MRLIKQRPDGGSRFPFKVLSKESSCVSMWTRVGGATKVLHNPLSPTGLVPVMHDGRGEKRGRSHVRLCAAVPPSCTSMGHQLGSSVHSLRLTHAALSFFPPLSAVLLINLEPLPSQTQHQGFLRLCIMTGALGNEGRSLTGNPAGFHVIKMWRI